jgi:autoinducer 2-degrading protein
MAIAILAQMRIDADDRPAFEGALTAHLAGTYAEEPGCLALNVHRAAKDPELLLVYELYRDAEALAEHERSARLAGFRAATEGRIRDGRIAYAQAAQPSAMSREVLPVNGAIAIFVQCRVEQRDVFNPLMNAHAAATLLGEPGCLAFGWHWSATDASAVQLYELYASQDALATHRASAQLRNFRTQVGALMLDARIHYAPIAWHAPLDRLLAHHGARRSGGI